MMRSTPKRLPKSFCAVEKFTRLHRMPRVIAFLIIAGTLTTYLAYRNYARVTPLSDTDRAIYDDL